MASSDGGRYQKEREVLGKTIAGIRKERGMTQEALAEKVEMNVSYLAKIENGYINTTLGYLIRISRALGVRVKDLFDF